MIYVSSIVQHRDRRLFDLNPQTLAKVVKGLNEMYTFLENVRSHRERIKINI